MFLISWMWNSRRRTWTKRSRRIVRWPRRGPAPAWKRVVQRLIVKGLPKPGAGRARGKSRKQLLRQRRASPQAFRVTFADDDVVAHPGEKPGAGAAAAQMQTVAKFEANHEAKYAVRPPANLGTNLVSNLVSNRGTTASI